MGRNMASDDTEITLGTGKLLGLFFLLVAVCGVFFAIGYSLGKSSAKEQALNDQAASAASENAGVTEPAKKPSAVVAVKSQPPAEEDPEAKKQNDLTFYKSVQQDQPNTQLTKPAQTIPATTTRVSPPASSPTTAATAASTAAAPATGRPSSAVDHGAFMVQIAAVSKQEDAEALAGALKKKSYNVLVVNNPAGTDKLYHVQIGPFASLPDAEAMRAKLMGDGYNPIVKR